MDLVTLREEIDYVQSYVNIQSFKYWDKFTVEYDIKEAEEALEAAVRDGESSF